MRLFHGTDVRSTGSGNIGATNVARSSKALGLATLLLDALKGYVAVTFAKRAAEQLAFSGPATFSIFTQSEQAGMALVGMAALCAMLGHMFPVWLKFKGGKGVATGVGVFLAIAWQPVLIVLIAFAVIYALTKYVSLGSIVATAAFPVVAFFFFRGGEARALMPFIVGIAILIIGKHHQNIRRLLSGTEHRLELKSK
jgi:glycerol-3-phosphate acyltransferase PlsY